METLTITQVWRYFRWLPKFLLRILFNKERLSGMVLLDVKPRHQAVSVNVVDPGYFNIYFQLVNMSPFEIELDRADIDFMCAGVRLRTMYIKKTSFKSGEIGTLFIEGEISTAQAERIIKLYDKNRSSINLHCDFNCGLHNFSKSNHNLDGVSVDFTNAEWLRKQLKPVT